MTNRLAKLEVTNFRSINDPVSVRLDAPVVLIHGNNGVGKTSLLTAIEYALTGRSSSLERIDQNYISELLHYGADEARISLEVEGRKTSHTTINGSGVKHTNKLSGPLSEFFSERCYLAQASLSQLLTIYQKASSDANSPLSRFVNELLGLDRLDALEAGLSHSLDLRNTKKLAPSYLTLEKYRDGLIAEMRTRTSEAAEAEAVAEATRAHLNTAREALRELGIEADTSLAANLNITEDSLQLSHLADLDRQVNSAERMVERLNEVRAGTDRSALEIIRASAESELANWRAGPGADIAALVQDIEDRALVGRLQEDQHYSARFESLRARIKSNADLISAQLAADASSRALLFQLSDERAQLLGRVKDLTDQMRKIGGSTTNVGRALAVVLPHVHENECPVCSRDFGEVSDESLSSHLARRIADLGDLAERLSGLSQELAAAQERLSAIENETVELTPSVFGNADLLGAQDRFAKLQALMTRATALSAAARVGGDLFGRTIDAQRAIDVLSATDTEERALRSVLGELAAALRVDIQDDTETFVSVIDRLRNAATVSASHLRLVIDLKAQASRLAQSLPALDHAAVNLSAQLMALRGALARCNTARADAENFRGTAKAMAKAVSRARTDVISSVFNDRLNKVWRDLFVRLAPRETFVPSFNLAAGAHVPQRIPQLSCLHRSGKTAGAPGVMLSAGNLNTAALTLFLALHLSVEAKLPWLLLDDPVQSMDDVHISQFAALLRTISKEQKRQVFIAVHDRPLFEYLRLEMSPAFSGDELITIELGSSAEGRTRFRTERRAYRADTALPAAAA